MSTPTPATGPVTITPEAFAAAREQAEKIAAAAIQGALIDELAKALAVNGVLTDRLNPEQVDEDAPSLD